MPPNEYKVPELYAHLQEPATQEAWGPICSVNPLGMDGVRPSISATPANMEIKCSGGDTPEILVRLEKKFGFMDKVELSFLPPKGLEGLKTTQVTVNKEETEGRIVLEPTKELPAGTHACELQTKYKFNNQAFDEKQAITLIVQAPPPGAETP